jgi:hypothetical protein
VDGLKKFSRGGILGQATTLAFSPGSIVETTPTRIGRNR